MPLPVAARGSRVTRSREQTDGFVERAEATKAYCCCARATVKVGRSWRDATGYDGLRMKYKMVDILVWQDHYLVTTCKSAPYE